jgi:hypothetical protein
MSIALDPVQEVIDRLESGVGPHRVLLDIAGTAVSPKRLEANGSHWTAQTHCVLVRSDGWSLGCTRAMYGAARELWSREWVALIAYANTEHRVTIKLAR